MLIDTFTHNSLGVVLQKSEFSERSAVK